MNAITDPRPQPAMDQLAKKHIPYELWMLREMYGLSKSGLSNVQVRNAVMESFAIHARNLIAFLEDRPKHKGRDDVWAGDFTIDDYATNAFPAGMRTKISKQMLHITCRRYVPTPGLSVLILGSDGLTEIQRDEQNQKHNHEDRKAALEAIEERMAAFVANLTPHYAAIWDEIGLLR